MYLAGWKEILPVDEVHVPRRLEGVSSGQRGTCTSPAGRKSFQSTRHVPRRLEGNPSSRRGMYLAGFRSTRYMYLVGRKKPLPVDEVHVPRRLEGNPSSRRGTGTSSTGRNPFQSTRYMYLVDWKEILPAGEVQVPRRPEETPSSRRGKEILPAGEVQVPRRPEETPSSRRGTCTSSTGRKSFQPARYMYLVGRKVHVPLRLEGNPSSRSLAGRLKGGYPRIPARIPAAADGYPPAGAGADADAWMAGKSSRISASTRISGCKSPISTPGGGLEEDVDFFSDAAPETYDKLAAYLGGKYWLPSSQAADCLTWWKVGSNVS
ncbi:hypothetical protein PGTUg99_004329 [Puccinia graminis f. sp. tritici]|uniref:Uncharacterized protein n=1 Tax=Puccinia graminis f. sp. tritici TaxID=56615 RepID=A0A5B0SFG4_PUCGR|nr:hypothetical protein PGTUg99_004329 [Puccinia graminis f. sp. tritici]